MLRGEVAHEPGWQYLGFLPHPKVSLLETTCPREQRLACSSNCLSTLLLGVTACQKQARSICSSAVWLSFNRVRNMKYNTTQVLSASLRTWKIGSIFKAGARHSLWARGEGGEVVSLSNTCELTSALGKSLKAYPVSFEDYQIAPYHPPVLPPNSLPLVWNPSNSLISVTALKTCVKCEHAISGRECVKSLSAITILTVILWSGYYLLPCRILRGGFPRQVSDPRTRDLPERVGCPVHGGHSGGSGRLGEMSKSYSNTLNLFCNMWPSP